MISGKSIAKGAAVVMMATLMSRMFGFVREMVIARQFGMTGDTDAYLVAFSVPSGIAMALAAALSAGFIPVLNGYLVKEAKEDAIKITNSLFNLFFLILLFLVIGMVNFAPAIVKLLAPGFNEQAVQLTTQLVVIMFPALIFVSLMGLAQGYLNSYQHFLFPASGPMITSLIIILSVVLLGPSLGIIGLAVGTLLGYAGQFFLQVPAMYRKGYRYRFDLVLKHPGVTGSLKLMLPVLIASLAPPLLLLVERGLASSLTEGSISALNYAFRLMQLPQGLFVMAVAVPLFPALSSLAAQREYDKLKNTVNKGIIALAVIMIPASAGLIALDEPIVRLLFQRGAFEAKDTAVTAYALTFYALALLPLALRDIFRRSFYALKDTLTPVAITLSAFVLNVLLDFIFVKLMGIAGLALGAAISSFAEAIILFVILNRKLEGFPWKGFLITIIKVLAAAAVMGVAAYGISSFIGSYLDIGSTIFRMVQVAVAVACGIVIYIAVLFMLKVEAINELYQMLKGILMKFGRAAR